MHNFISHHGAVDGVTGSCHELRTASGDGVLIDCGLFQGDEAAPEGRASAEQLAIDFPIEHIRALLVTHVHIDHTGRIPYLFAAGFDGPIICSKPSALLLPLVLEDAMRIGVTRDRKVLERFRELLEQKIIALDYDDWYEITPELSIRLQRAGHILGSAYVECRLGSGDSAHHVVFSGDLGPPNTPILCDPQAPQRADTLVLESTYGDHDHENRAQRIERLQSVLEHALRDRGAILVPAFSIGRTQELLYELEELIHRNRDTEVAAGLPWDELEIIVDSPLASRFTKVYRQLKQYWDAEAKEKIANGRHPLAFEQLTTINDHKEHQQTVKYLKKTARPCVVIAAGGMCSGGRILNYLKALLGDSRHDVLFVGYQARGTPGNVIQHHGPHGGYVRLDGEKYNIRAQVHTIGGYSAHAGQADLLAFVSGIPQKPQEIRLVHGDDGAKQALQKTLQALGHEVSIPVR
ncbi:MBL fold metallo-hydrolase RNA specificity domain-containing protein [Candidatus Venteria ishoeyi]|uniref:Ribonuclease n=1 Tax=Candidatus Venteria ishoeyi TaxID=1899563 RepID=A0A1H6FGA5_9GAMM|nr:MBL fold metallo-hydrolase [Candidatus Venteria ishoeyi]MDM8545694.1 MBL fold metallo-hydrolase [Candidatus Venteria ishoeyi]SEH09092.1 Ribonuclease [Candidatus Venteria ishoeyi]